MPNHTEHDPLDKYEVSAARDFTGRVKGSFAGLSLIGKISFGLLVTIVSIVLVNAGGLISVAVNQSTLATNQADVRVETAKIRIAVNESNSATTAALAATKANIDGETAARMQDSGLLQGQIDAEGDTRKKEFDSLQAKFNAVKVKLSKLERDLAATQAQLDAEKAARLKLEAEIKKQPSNL